MDPAEARKLTLARLRDAEKRIAESRKASPVLSTFHHGSCLALLFAALTLAVGLPVGVMAFVAGDVQVGRILLAVAALGALGLLPFWHTFRRSDHAGESVRREILKDEELVQRLRDQLASAVPLPASPLTPEARKLRQARIRDAEQRIKDKSNASPVLGIFYRLSGLGMAISVVLAAIGATVLIAEWRDVQPRFTWGSLLLALGGLGGVLLFLQTARRSARAEKSVDEAVQRDKALIRRLRTELEPPSTVTPLPFTERQPATTAHTSITQTHSPLS